MTFCRMTLIRIALCRKTNIRLTPSKITFKKSELLDSQGFKVVTVFILSGILVNVVLNIVILQNVVVPQQQFFGKEIVCFKRLLKY